MIIKNSSLSLFTTVVVFGCFSIARLLAGSVAQTGFERGDQSWELYVPAESGSAGCNFRVGKIDTHQGTSYAVLSSKAPARLGLHPKANPVLVAPGEKYRFGLWVKAGPDWLAVEESPGLILQCGLRDAFQKDLIYGPLFIGFKGVSHDPAKLSGLPLLPRWIKIEGTIEIPSGASEMIPFVFVWKGSGHIFIDDIAVDKVSADTHLTPILD